MSIRENFTKIQGRVLTVELSHSVAAVPWASLSSHAWPVHACALCLSARLGPLGLTRQA